MLPRSFDVVDCQPQPQADGSLLVCLWGTVMLGDVEEAREVRLMSTGDEFDADFLGSFDHVRTLQLLATSPSENVQKSIIYHIYLQRRITN